MVNGLLVANRTTIYYSPFTIHPLFPMSSQRWRQLEEIFQTALDLSETDRSQFIDRACATDPELRHDVETLLTQYEEAGSLLDQSVYDQNSIQELASLIATDPDPMIGQRLGAYRIEREI